MENNPDLSVVVVRLSFVVFAIVCIIISSSNSRCHYQFSHLSVLILP